MSESTAAGADAPGVRHEDDVITVLFEQEGYKTLSRTAVLENGHLKRA